MLTFTDLDRAWLVLVALAEAQIVLESCVWLPTPRPLVSRQRAARRAQQFGFIRGRHLTARG